MESVPHKTLFSPTYLKSFPRQWAALSGSPITPRQVLPSSA